MAELSLLSLLSVWELMSCQGLYVARFLKSSGTILRASLRVPTQFFGHNVNMTGREFAILTEVSKHLYINMLRKSVICRHEAISPTEFTDSFVTINICLKNQE